MHNYILAIDQGTTSTRAMLFDLAGKIVAQQQQEFKQYFPQEGWVEHDPEEIWQSTLRVTRAILEQVDHRQVRVATLGITNQRETTIVWDKQTGKPVYPAIVWQDRRTAYQCRALQETGYAELIQEKTGLLLDPYFSASKLAWILKETAGLEKARRGEWLFGTVDTFLLWRLTNGQVHATDATNASRTLLFNLQSQQWDPMLLDLFGIPQAMLPEVRDNCADYGVVAKEHFGQEIPITALVGDQQAAAIGQGCLRPGMAKSTYGTGCFAILNTGSQRITSHNRLLTTTAYRLAGKPSFALEGSIFVAGAAVQWLRDGLKLIGHASETEALARSVPNTGGVYLVPAFTGLGAPYWDPQARGAILGLTRNSNAAHLARATLEAVCYQTRDLFKALCEDAGKTLEVLRVDGGMMANQWLAQFLADTLQVTVERPIMLETTAFGAALLAGVGAKLFTGLEECSQLWQAERRYEPQLSKQQSEQQYAGWLRAVQRVRHGSEVLV